LRNVGTNPTRNLTVRAVADGMSCRLHRVFAALLTVVSSSWGVLDTMPRSRGVLPGGQARSGGGGLHGYRGGGVAARQVVGPGGGWHHPRGRWAPAGGEASSGFIWRLTHRSSGLGGSSRPRQARPFVFAQSVGFTPQPTGKGSRCAWPSHPRAAATRLPTRRRALSRAVLGLVFAGAGAASDSDRPAVTDGPPRSYPRAHGPAARHRATTTLRAPGG